MKDNGLGSKAVFLAKIALLMSLLIFGNILNTNSKYISKPIGNLIIKKTQAQAISVKKENILKRFANVRE